MPKKETTRQLHLETEVVPYELRYAQRKTLGIKINLEGKVIVTAPLRTTLSTIEGILQQRGHWILKHRQRLQALPQPPTRRYISGETEYYLGQALTLEVVAGAKERVQMSAGKLYVTTPHPDQPAAIERQLQRWYRQQAASLFAERLKICFAQVSFLQADYPTLTIRRMKSRWGSCSAKGRVTLNQSLIHVALDLVDYVILHELCHLRELNHSPAYYALLDRALPDWREKRQRLKQMRPL
jgi:hypothetical protein